MNTKQNKEVKIFGKIYDSLIFSFLPKRIPFMDFAVSEFKVNFANKQNPDKCINWKNKILK